MPATCTRGWSRRPRGRRSSSARTWTRCRRPGRSSRWSRTASSGTPAATILGADNKSAVVAMVETARRVVARRVPHAGLELLFTPKEEVGLRGAQAFDCSRLRRPGRVRLRPGRADRRGDPRRAALDDHGDHLRRPVRPRGHGAGGGPLCDRGRRPRDRRHAARTARRGDLRQRRRHPRAALPATSSPTAASLNCEARSHDETEARGRRPGDARRLLVRRLPGRDARSRPR